MDSTKRGWTDERSEQTIGILLRTGVIAAAVVVFGGGLLYVARYGFEPIHYHAFRGEPGDLRHVSGIVRGAFTWHARGIIQLGLLLLIATPVARVAYSVFAFAMERDWTYVVVTLIVLALLVYSLSAGGI